MAGFHRKRKIQRVLYSPASILVLSALVLFLASSVWSVYNKDRATRVKRDKGLAELHDLEARATFLEAEIDRLSSVRGKEEEIRRKFEIAREGESVIVIIDKEKESEEETQPPAKSFWRKFLDWF